MNHKPGFIETISKHSDLLLAGGVVLIISLMVIRIPPGMMDILLGLNISISALVLLVALYVPNAMKLPSFPTIILLTTLFRLGLNVSSTRLILLEAHAGDIIDAFGEFVVGGNFVVGGIVFVVLVLIQFIVVAKGSERVAEVAARFTLDAMPGKQMSIDADLRGGLLTAEQARDRRQNLERESKLYGAMDGAMKFVKGDAIAGIIIAIVNIVGGLVVGVMQQGMEVGEAAEIYSLLTIGDGLVSQIPALLISVAAGLVVTRVAAGGDDSKSHVASEMLNQVLAQPKAIAVVAAVLLAMGLLPGFPMWVFWGLGIAAGAVAFTALNAPPGALSPAGVPATRGDAGADAGPAAEAETKRPRGPIPVVLEFHSQLAPLFIETVTAAGPDGQPHAVTRSIPRVQQHLTQLRIGLEEEFGFPFPPVVLRPDDRYFIIPGYAILLYDAPIASATMLADQVYLSAKLTREAAEELGFKAMTPLPWTRAHMPVVTEAFADDAIARITATAGAGQDVRKLPARDVIMEHLRVMLSKHAAEFLGIQETSDLLERLKESRPDLVKAVVPVMLNHAQLTEVLKGLLREQVPIRDLRLIMESIARHAPNDRPAPQSPVDLKLLTEHVRYDLRRVMCARFAASRQRLPFYSVAHDLENAVADAMQHSNGQVVLALAPEQRKQIVIAFAKAIDPHSHLGQPAVVVVNQPSVRRPIWNLLEPYLPEVVVLSYQDLVPELSPQPVSVVMSGE